jgi:hypothetical protein
MGARICCIPAYDDCKYTMWVSRRTVTLGLPWAFLHSPGLDNTHSPRFLSSTTVGGDDDEDILAEWICRFTPASFRAAVQETNHFLYRGATETVLKQQQAALLLQPAPDLLFPETYDNDPMALAYFQCLEDRLDQEFDGNNRSSQQQSVVQAKPSTGHIATSNPEEAGKWGPVVSVWPIVAGDDQWSYVWPRDRETFYDNDSDAAHHDRGPSSSKSSCRDEDQLIIDIGLVEALQKPREVLFATTGLQPARSAAATTRTALPRIISMIKPSSSLIVAPSAFLAISQDQDERLRNKLATRNYGFLR